MTTIRPARQSDLPAIVRLLANDPLGATRERDQVPLAEPYRAAFAAIQAQEGNQVLVAVREEQVVGCLQLTMIPGLSRLGMTRAQIEGVRIDAKARGAGLGEDLVRHAIAQARACGCGLVQLTTDKKRPDAHRFYARLGFEASHEGMKLSL